MNKTPIDRTKIEIERVLKPRAEIRALVEELDRDLSQKYAPETRHALDLDKLFEPHIRLFIARIEGEAVGCGGVALFSEFAEIKRMYVRPESRGCGVAVAIMARVISESVLAGLKIIRLETGTRSFAALRFYERSGFRVCDMFEPYSSMAPAKTVASVFMEMRL
nr:MAG: GNAT family N-acetyltransferase [Hyphomicrobiales bacterium]